MVTIANNIHDILDADISANFKPKGQPTSKTDAINRYIQAIYHLRKIRLNFVS